MTSSGPTPLAGAYANETRGVIDLLGWDYPSVFSDPVQEHGAVREGASLFDFSFMAHARVRGRRALAFLQSVVTRDLAPLAPGAARYSPIANPHGGLVDDCTVLCTRPEEYLLTAFHDPSRTRVRGTPAAHLARR